MVNGGEHRAPGRRPVRSFTRRVGGLDPRAALRNGSPADCLVDLASAQVEANAERVVEDDLGGHTGAGATDEAPRALPVLVATSVARRREDGGCQETR